MLGIAQGTIISTNSGNKLVEKCPNEVFLLSKYSLPKRQEITEISQASIVHSENEVVYLLQTADGRTIETTEKCRFVCEEGIYSLFNIPVDAKVLTVDGYVNVDKIVSKRNCELYTIIMSDNHSFVANGFVVSNFAL